MTYAQTEYKITVLGSGGVGKSALTIRLITGQYESNYDPTIEDSYRKQVQIDGIPALLDILDTAGQEEYAALQDQWIREGDGFLLVYAINIKDSYDEAIALYHKIQRILDLDDHSVPIVLCGNKCDLPSAEHEVGVTAGRAQAEKWDCSHVQTSAKDRINVEEAFFNVVREIRRRNPTLTAQKPKQRTFCEIL